MFVEGDASPKQKQSLVFLRTRKFLLLFAYVTKGTETLAT